MSSSFYSIMAQSNTGSDWNWFLTFVIFVVVLAVALIIQAMFSKHDAAELEFHEEETHHEETPHEAAEPLPAAPAQPQPEAQAEVELAPEPEPQPETPAQPDDLKKLEGIGPKVADLLNNNGITTFAQLADTSVETLEELLAANKLQMMHPASWPQQARLAAAGDWEALQKMQNELKGGR